MRKPDIPSKHLVAYAIPWDRKSRRILMIDHRLSGLWLPPGGHVEEEEPPAVCAIRELHEELAAVPMDSELPTPVFLTVQGTVGTPSHDDVSLWFTIAVDPDKPMVPDPWEIRSVRWLDYTDILTNDGEAMEPNMHRFAGKLRGLGML
ncbi:MAG: NUDIX domain-containing protein [Thermomicrobiales bacterium]